MADADKNEAPKPKKGAAPKPKGRKLEESLAMIRGDFSKHKKVY